MVSSAGGSERQLLLRLLVDAATALSALDTYNASAKAAAGNNAALQQSFASLQQSVSALATDTSTSAAHQAMMADAINQAASGARTASQAHANLAQNLFQSGLSAREVGQAQAGLSSAFSQSGGAAGQFAGQVAIAAQGATTASQAHANLQQILMAGGTTAQQSGQAHAALAQQLQASASAANTSASAHQQLGQQMGLAGSSASTLGGTLRELAAGYYLVTQVAGDIGRVAEEGFRATVGAAADYQRQIQLVQANTTLTDTETKQLSTDLLTMASQTAAPLNGLAIAFRLIRDEGVGYQDALAVLNVVQQESVATGAKVEDVARAGALAMHDYGVSASDAANFLGVQMRAAQLGDTTLEQFSEGTRRATALASGLGVSWVDNEAALSALTRTMGSADQANTALVNIYSHIVNVTPQMRKEIEALAASGIDVANDFGIQAVQGKGLAEVITDLSTKLQGHDDAIVKLMPNLRGTIGFLDLLTNAYHDNKDAVSELMNIQEGKATPIADAYARAQQTVSVQWDEAKNKAQVLGVMVGQTLLPAVSELITKAQQVEVSVKNWADANQSLLKQLGSDAISVIKIFGEGLGLTVTILGDIAKWALEAAKGIDTFELTIGHLVEHIPGLKGVGEALVSDANNGLAVWNPLIQTIDDVQKTVDALGKLSLSSGSEQVAAWNASDDAINRLHASTGAALPTMDELNKAQKDAATLAHDQAEAAGHLVDVQDQVRTETQKYDEVLAQTGPTNQAAVGQAFAAWQGYANQLEGLYGQMAGATTAEQAKGIQQQITNLTPLETAAKKTFDTMAADSLAAGKSQTEAWKNSTSDMEKSATDFLAFTKTTTLQIPESYRSALSQAEQAVQSTNASIASIDQQLTTASSKEDITRLQNHRSALTDQLSAAQSIFNQEEAAAQAMSSSIANAEKAVHEQALADRAADLTAVLATNAEKLASDLDTIRQKRQAEDFSNQESIAGLRAQVQADQIKVQSETNLQQRLTDLAKIGADQRIIVLKTEEQSRLDALSRQEEAAVAENDKQLAAQNVLLQQYKADQLQIQAEMDSAKSRLDADTATIDEALMAEQLAAFTAMVDKEEGITVSNAQVQTQAWNTIADAIGGKTGEAIKAASSDIEHITNDVLPGLASQASNDAVAIGKIDQNVTVLNAHGQEIKRWAQDGATAIQQQFGGAIDGVDNQLTVTDAKLQALGKQGGVYVGDLGQAFLNASSDATAFGNNATQVLGNIGFYASQDTQQVLGLGAAMSSAANSTASTAQSANSAVPAFVTAELAARGTAIAANQAAGATASLSGNMTQTLDSAKANTDQQNLALLAVQQQADQEAVVAANIDAATVSQQALLDGLNQEITAVDDVIRGLQDQLTLQRDILAVQGQTDTTNPALLGLNVQKDTLEIQRDSLVINGQSTTELDKQITALDNQIKQEQDKNKLASDQLSLQYLGTTQQLATLAVEKDRLSIQADSQKTIIDTNKALQDEAQNVITVTDNLKAQLAVLQAEDKVAKDLQSTVQNTANIQKLGGSSFNLSEPAGGAFSLSGAGFTQNPGGGFSLGSTSGTATASKAGSGITLDSGGIIKGPLYSMDASGTPITIAKDITEAVVPIGSGNVTPGLGGLGGGIGGQPIVISLAGAYFLNATQVNQVAREIADAVSRIQYGSVAGLQRLGLR